MNNLKIYNASAGTGKTYQLIQEIVQRITKEGMDPEAFMVTTFTRRAAYELQERIREGLLQSGWEGDVNRALDGFVGTVDSLCARLLREYAIDAGLSPALTTLPEENAIEIFRQATDAAIEKYLPRMAMAERRLSLDGSVGFNEKTDWRDDVMRVVNLARNNDIRPDTLRQFATSSYASFTLLTGEPTSADLDAELLQVVEEALPDMEQEYEQKKTDAARKRLLRARNILDKDIEHMTWNDWLKLDADFIKKYSKIQSFSGKVRMHPRLQKDVQTVIESVFNCAADAMDNYDRYKRENALMDFIDQETKLYHLARDHEAFRSAFRQRIRVLMVDEFQDTSPIQLALFLTLGELVEEAIWVGDPKQAIYGFRDADPELMNAVALKTGRKETLGHSWRSKEVLISFTNELFKEVFQDIEGDFTPLQIPPQREEKAKGGDLELWRLLSTKKDEVGQTTAQGVQDLLNRRPELKPKDIAVLCRRNLTCELIAGHLEHLGIRASVSQGLLLETAECRYAMAALRYMLDSQDTVALAILSQAHASDQMWYQLLMADPEKTKEDWKRSPLAQVLSKARSGMSCRSPLEALEAAIVKSGLLDHIKKWPDPARARNSLDLLRKHCLEYQETSATHFKAATVAGFIDHMDKLDAKQVEGYGDDTVNVLTYHGSKGLEWPWVILTELDVAPQGRIFGAKVQDSDNLDITRPLANRTIRYWPWPFGGRKTETGWGTPSVEVELSGLEEMLAEREDRRLLYVGMTRARDGMVLSLNEKKGSLNTAWLDVLYDESGSSLFQVHGDVVRAGGYTPPFQIHTYLPAEGQEATVPTRQSVYQPPAPEDLPTYPLARLAPSKLTVDGLDATSWQFRILHNFDQRIRIKGQPDMGDLGNAVHAYFATAPEEGREEEIAKRCLVNWGVDEALEAADVVEARSRFDRFIEGRYQEGKTLQEWPVAMRNEANQTTQGWIDLLIENPEGYTIIDHKDYPGADALERMERYIPQLLTYKEIVEKATGKLVKELLIHLPVSGYVLELMNNS